MKGTERQILELQKDLSDCLQYDIDDSNTVDTYDTAFYMVNKFNYQKIDKDSVVLSRKEYEKLNMKYISALEQLENKSKETAEKILNKCDEFYYKYISADFAFNVFIKWLKEEFGIEIKES